MPKLLRYTPEFKEQCVRLVFAEIGPEESRKAACERLGARVNVKPVTLYNWVKEAAPTAAPASPPRHDGGPARPSWPRCARRIRELARANEILRAAASFFGAELDRQSKK